MPPDGEPKRSTNGVPAPDSTDKAIDPKNVSPTSAFSRQAQNVRDFFSVPAPVKRLFEAVPLLVYESNELPERALKVKGGGKGTRGGNVPSLYVFAKEEDARSGRPSFNPGCLRWQAFLKIAGVEHKLISSNNHASPTGILPFLIPAVQDGGRVSPDSLLPIPSNKLVKYVSEKGGKVHEPDSVRHEAYQSLLDNRIRNAWLYNLYLEPGNFSTVATRLYVLPTSSNPVVQATISSQLRQAALTELLKSSTSPTCIDVDDLYSEADKAFEALSTLLGDNDWFFGNDGHGHGTGPGLFDASVFAYTHLLLEERMGWKTKRLLRLLRKRENLVAHRERFLLRYFTDEEV